MAKPTAETAIERSTASRQYRIEKESLASLQARAHSKNPKDHDLGSIIQAILRFGFVNPVMVDEATGTMVAGHGRVLALLAMRNDGQEPPEGIDEDERNWYVPVIRGVSFANESDRDAYLIADNNLTMKGGWLTEELTNMLQALAESDAEHGLDGTGFDNDDLDALLADKNYEPPPAPPPPELETQYGVWCRVRDKAAENQLADLMARYGYESFRRFSEE